MWIPVELTIENLMSHKNTKYTFENGKAVLIYGINLDDDGAESNGSGKSTIMEGVSIAFTGDGLRRGARTKELVRRGCKSANISLTLENKYVGEVIKINRVLHSNTKPSEVQIFINGQQNVNLVSVSDANEFILNKIGISRDDLYSYYLISKEKYTPFFISSDTVKKQIISRFSGSDSLDDIEKYVKVDVSELENQLNSLQLLKSNTEGKINAYNESLLELSNEVSSEVIALKIQRLNEEKQSLIQSIDLELDNKSKVEREIVELSNEVLQLEQAYKEDCEKHLDKIKSIENGIDKLNEEISTINKQLDHLSKQIQSEVEHKEIELKDIDIEIKSLREQKTVLEQERSNEVKNLSESEDLKLHLQSKVDGGVVCPKCHHKFLLDKNMTIEEARELLKETDLIIEQIQPCIEFLTKEISSLEKSIDSYKKKQIQINSEIDKIRNKSTETKKQIHFELDNRSELIRVGESSIKAIKLESSNNLKYIEEQNHILESKKNVKTRIEQKIESLRNDLNGFDDRINSAKQNDNVDKIEPLRIKIKQLEQDLLKIDSDIENKSLEIDETKSWVHIFKSFKSTLANKSIKAIEEYTNLYLAKMGSNLSIETDGYKELSNGKLKEEISARVLRGGIDDGSYGVFSSGERGRIDITSVCAIQTLLNTSCESGGLNLLIVDEALDSIDSKGIESIIKALQDIGKNILIISQNTGVNIDSRYLVKIQKQGSIAKIV